MSIPGAASPLFLATTAGAAAGFEISRSLRFNSADSAYLNRTPSSAGNQTTWTWSAWIKKATVGSSDRVLFQGGNTDFNDDSIRFDSSDRLSLSIFNGSNALSAQLTSAAVFRDPSAWYHVVVVFDTSNSTADNRIRFYVNGSELTAFSTRINPSQNLVSHDINAASIHLIGTYRASSQYFDGYLADVNFIDGSALDPTSFGAFDDNGVWQAIDTSGLSFGTNGFRLKFADNSSDALLGTDSSGNSNTWTVNNLSVGSASNRTAQQNFDVVAYSGTGSARSISDLAFQPDFVWLKARDSGSYSHNLLDSVRGATKILYSDSTSAENTDANSLTSFNTNGFALGSTAATNNNGTNYIAWCWNAGANSNKTYTVKVVSDSGNKYRFDDFGTSAVTLDLAEGSTYIFDQSDSSNAGHPIRFGTSANGTDYTTGVTHTGTPGSAGAKTTLVLASGAATLYYSCLNHSGMGGQINTNSTAGASNFAGSIQANTKANADYGFSVCTYTGTGLAANVGHGLDAAPKLIILKDRSSAYNWQVYHESFAGTSNGIVLNSTSGIDNGSGAVWNSTTPASTVFSIGNSVGVNTSGNNYVAYVWSEVVGFSKFGSYTGSGSSGKTVTTGFKPRFVLVKRTTNISGSHMGWSIVDSERGSTQKVQAQSAVAENDGPINAASPNDDVTFNDDGFTLASGGAASNASGETYIYMAFAATTLNQPGIDSLVDTPTNAAEPTDTGVGNEVVGNYATWNPLNTPSGITLSNGNLDCQLGSSGDATQLSTIGMSSGKWYAEITGVSTTGGFYNAIGLGKEGASGYLGSNAQGWGYHQDGRKIAGGGAASYGASYAQGDVIGVAFDADNGTLTFYKNGSSQGTAYTGLTSGPYFFAVGSSQTKNVANFGQRAFAYPLSSNPIYSQSVSGPVSVSPYDVNNMFDGSLTSYADHQGQNTTITWTYTLTNVTSLRVYIHQGNSTGTVATVGGNGTQTDTISANFGPDWHTISLSSTGSTINSIAFTRGGSGNFLSIYAIEVNGTVLVEGAGAIYKSLNTANLPTPTIADGSLYFDTKLYTGTGSNQSLTGLAFQSDFVWIKTRNEAENHFIVDSVRGVTKQLYANITDAEYTNSNRFKSFDSNGFTVGTTDDTNQSGNSFVAWAWDGGTSTVTNNDGSIASSVRASAASGFSIVSYAGNSVNNSTIGHGLNAAPKLIITKNRDGAYNWITYSAELAATKVLALDGTYAAFTPSGGYYSNVGNSTYQLVQGSANLTNVNNSGNDYIAYCFAPVAGYSAMGSYTGNGSSDGPFIHTGFKVKWLLVKLSSAANGNWWIWDSEREPVNPITIPLYANTTAAETSNGTGAHDLLSNGFKFRGTGGAYNTNGYTYIYLAFASNPFASNGGLAR